MREMGAEQRWGAREGASRGAPADVSGRGTTSAVVRRMVAIDTVSQLNAFLLGELAAIEMYRRASRRGSVGATPELTTCRRSHETRCKVLRETIASLGGSKPGEAPAGASSAEAEAARRAAPRDDRPTVEALEREEGRMLAQYQTDVRSLDPAVRIFVEVTLLDQQERTHRAIHELKLRIAAA
jgi:hypothetical protein